MDKFTVGKLLGITLLSTSVTSCNTALTKEGMGASLGAIVGGLAGSQVSDKYKKEMTVLGAFAGAYVGGKIGKHLDEQDRKRMEQTTQQALATGQNQTWVNPENNTRGEAKVVSTTTKSETIKVPVLKDKVTKVPPLEIIGQNYKSNSKVNLRGGPGTDYVIVGSLESREIVNVVGKVKDSNWYLLSQGGAGSGFIREDLVSPAFNEQVTDSTSNLSGNDVVITDVSSAATCREIKQTVTLADGSRKSETIEACQTPDGWVAKA